MRSGGWLKVAEWYGADCVCFLGVGYDAFLVPAPSGKHKSGSRPIPKEYTCYDDGVKQGNAGCCYNVSSTFHLVPDSQESGEVSREWLRIVEHGMMLTNPMVKVEGDNATCVEVLYERT